MCFDYFGAGAGAVDKCLTTIYSIIIEIASVEVGMYGEKKKVRGSSSSASTYLQCFTTVWISCVATT